MSYEFLTTVVVLNAIATFVLWRKISASKISNYWRPCFRRPLRERQLVQQAAPPMRPVALSCDRLQAEPPQQHFERPAQGAHRINTRQRPEDEHVSRTADHLCTSPLRAACTAFATSLSPNRPQRIEGRGNALQVGVRFSVGRSAAPARTSASCLSFRLNILLLLRRRRLRLLLRQSCQRVRFVAA